MRKKPLKHIIFITAVFLLIFSFVCVYSFGDDKTDLKSLQSEISTLNSQLSKGKADSSSLNSQIKSIEKQIYSSEVEISNLESEINNTKLEILEAYDKLAVKQTEVAEQNEALNERLRALYKSGEVGILSVLFGSSSMSDLMTNMDIIERIYDSDANVLAQLRAQYTMIDNEKTELLNLKDKLTAQQENLENKKTALADNKTALASAKSKVDSNNSVLEKQIDALNDEANALTAKILGLQGTGDYVGGTMIWPSAASTTISSPFGNRLHPILKVYKMHTGIDIAASGGTNILAANAGIVISAGWNNSYGYMVMVDHGGGIVTLYAHSSKLLVSKGDIVTRGQAIALVGSTGMSTGNHLHFEVRVNGVYKNPLDYVSTSVRK